MEELVRKGLVRNIGVSNFSIEDIRTVQQHSQIPVAVNQFECHPYMQLRELRQFCAEQKIVVTAHTSLGSPGNPWPEFHPPKLMEDKVILQISNKYSKSTANVLCRWAQQRNMIVLPKSITPVRIAENINGLNFDLSEVDLQLIDELDMGPKGRFNHPVTPWLGRGPFPDDVAHFKQWQQFDGLVCAVLTPFNTDDSINFQIIDR